MGGLEKAPQVTLACPSWCLSVSRGVFVVLLLMNLQDDHPHGARGLFQLKNLRIRKGRCMLVLSGVLGIFLATILMAFRGVE